MNYLADVIFEDSACKALIEQFGQDKFDWVAQRVEALDKRFDSGEFDWETVDNLDAFFPVEDLANAVEYLYRFATAGNDQELKAWAKEQKEKGHGY